MMGVCNTDIDLTNRSLLYTDTICGEQIGRDDMWAITTEELNAKTERIHELEAENETLSNQYDICAQEARCMGDELAALRQQQGEPVAWMLYRKNCFSQPFELFLSKPEWWSAENYPSEVLWPLYRETAPRVPEGWKLVPVEPTNAMVYAQDKLLMRGVTRGSDEIYRAMLAAAPEPKGGA